jgi:hypothetical protein
VILVACLSVLIAAFTPFWGVIFIFTLGAKYQQDKHYQQFYGLILLLTVILFLLRIIDIISLTDILAGVALTSLLFFRLLAVKFDYFKAIIIVTLLNIIYGIVSYLLFSRQIMENINVISEEYLKILTETIPQNQDSIGFASGLIETMKYIITNFSPGIWVLTVIIAVYVGSLLLSARISNKWMHRHVQLPYTIVYPLILCLAAFLFPNSRIPGLNGLIMMLPLFLIQGLSILDFFWGERLRKAKLILVLLVIAMVFNPYLIIIIAVLGLTDIWFNFRKIRIQEDIDENNLN